MSPAVRSVRPETAPAETEPTTRRCPLSLLLFPAAGLASAVVVALLMWSRLPDTMTSHWGSGGADAAMPKAWVLGSFLVVGLGGMCWPSLRVVLRRPARAVMDAALLGGLFAWVGTMGLVSSIWFAEQAGAAAFITLVVPILLTASVLFWSDRRARADTTHRAV